VKPAERARQQHAHDKTPQSQDAYVVRGTQVEVTNPADKDIADHQIGKSPKYVHG
jgi:hypothetical protein